MRAFLLVFALTSSFAGGLSGCGGRGAAEDAVASVQGAPSGPIEATCPLPGECVVGGYRFGDNWGFASCPSGTPKKHTGVDLHAAAGTQVNAPADGTVMLVYDAGAAWASAILIEHRDAAGRAYVTQEMHVDPLVRAGDRVARGQQIATVAHIATPHLHFAVWDGPYDSADHMMRRGALPRSGCNGDVAFPASFIDPGSYIPIQ